MKGERICCRSAAPEYVVEAEAVWVGRDLLVCLRGGDRPHIGAVAAAEPRESLRGDGSWSATASVLTYPGHKEDGVAKHAAERLASRLRTRVVVAAGMHWDNLGVEGIDRVVRHCREVVEALVRDLGGWRS